MAVTFIPQIISLFIVMAVFSLVLGGIIFIIAKINHTIQESRMRRKLSGIVFVKEEKPTTEGEKPAKAEKPAK